MGEFNSDDHYIYYCGQESLIRNGVALIVNKAEVAVIPHKKWSNPHGQQKSSKCSTWMQSQKQQDDLCSFLRQTIQYHSNPSLCLNK